MHASYDAELVLPASAGIKADQGSVSGIVSIRVGQANGTFVVQCTQSTAALQRCKHVLSKRRANRVRHIVHFLLSCSPCCNPKCC